MNRQKQILAVFENDKDKVLTKQEIIKKSGISYYCNTSKHVGDTLSRMVKNKSLMRVSKGKYKLGSGGGPKDFIPKNQGKLFGGQILYRTFAMY